MVHVCTAALSMTARRAMHSASQAASQVGPTLRVSTTAAATTSTATRATATSGERSCDGAEAATWHSDEHVLLVVHGACHGGCRRHQRQGRRRVLDLWLELLNGSQSRRWRPVDTWCPRPIPLGTSLLPKLQSPPSPLLPHPLARLKVRKALGGPHAAILPPGFAHAEGVEVTLGPQPMAAGSGGSQVGC